MKRLTVLIAVLFVLTAGAAGASEGINLLPVVSNTGTMSLRWDAVPGADGYRVYYGTQPGLYEWVLDVGNTTQGTLTDLLACRDYYAAVKAYNFHGESPDFSNEIEGWARPNVQSNSQEVLMQGGQYVVNIIGANFAPEANLELDVADAFGDALIHVDSLDVLSCNQIQALLTVEPQVEGVRAMQIGDHRLRIRNPDGPMGESDYTVMLDPERKDVNRSEPDTLEQVNGKDLVWLSFAHGAGQGDARYNPDADLNGDGFIDGEDLAHMASAFGKCWDGGEWTPEACGR